MDYTKVLQLPSRTPTSGDVVEVAGGGGVYSSTIESLGNAVANSVAYTKAAAGTNTLLAAGPARRVVILITTNEDFADGNGAKTVLTIGEEGGSATKFVAAASIGTTAGNIIIASGLLTGGKKLEVYATAATGTGTGGITATVIGVKASS